MEVPDLKSVVEAQWGFCPTDIRLLTGGMNSVTWQVQHQDRRYVAKLVPHALGAALGSGLIAASVVDVAGIPAGAAHQTLFGKSAV